MAKQKTGPCIKQKSAKHIIEKRLSDNPSPFPLKMRRRDCCYETYPLSSMKQLLNNSLQTHDGIHKNCCLVINKIRLYLFAKLLNELCIITTFFSGETLTTLCFRKRNNNQALNKVKVRVKLIPLKLLTTFFFFSYEPDCIHFTSSYKDVVLLLNISIIEYDKRLILIKFGIRNVTICLIGFQSKARMKLLFYLLSLKSFL